MAEKYEETKYEDLLEFGAQRIYEQGFASTKGTKQHILDNPWARMPKERKETYRMLAMQMIGHLLGPGEWKRIRQIGFMNRVVFERTDE